MSATRATVALGLMKKVLPDLQSTSHEGPGEGGEIIIENRLRWMRKGEGEGPAD